MRRPRRQLHPVERRQRVILRQMCRQRLQKFPRPRLMPRQMPQDQKEPLRNRPQFEPARHIPRQRPGPFMRRIAVQIDVQPRPGLLDQRQARRLLIQRRPLARLHIVAQRRIARRVMHVPRVGGPEPVMQRIAVRIFARNKPEPPPRRPQHPRRPQRAHNPGRLIGMLPGRQQHRRPRPVEHPRHHHPPLHRGYIPNLPPERIRRRHDLRLGRRAIGILDRLRPRPAHRHRIMPPQTDPHPRRPLRGHDLRHDLPRLGRPIHRPQPCPRLHHIEDREIEILVQRLRRADHLIPIRHPTLDPRHLRLDRQHLETRPPPGPAMPHHRRHPRPEHRLILRLQRPIAHHHARGIDMAEPPARRQHLNPQRIRPHHIGRKHRHRRPPIDRHLIRQRRPARPERHAGLGIHPRQRIRLQSKPLRRPRRMRRQPHRDAPREAPHLLQDIMHQRLVGAAQPRLHPRRRQPRLRHPPRRRIVEHPGLHRRPPMPLRKPRHQRIHRPRHRDIEQNSHDTLRVVGSVLSRSRAPSRFSSSIVSMTASPGATARTA